ncbi:STAS domain-containing protein [Streptomyces sp. NPDC003717]|uniref:STAS domain-containing protein n=1 Tax=Streptomyces sp. NPDC003717 TaxID=3154276 RepID=UPI0033BCDEE4
MSVPVAIEGNAAVFTPRGDVDSDTLPGLLATARRLPPTVTRVTWDLRHTVFMDIAGLHLLIDQREECRGAGRLLTVTGLGEQPLRLLRLAGQLFPAGPWNDFLPAAPSASAA